MISKFQNVTFQLQTVILKTLEFCLFKLHKFRFDKKTNLYILEKVKG